MRIGTRSILYGYHCFFIHPFFVALAWWKLYGFPWDPRLWVAFCVHDLGYLGKPNMDGEEGERHPYLGARIMGQLFDRPRWWLNMNINGHNCCKWYQFTLLHSRFLSKRLNLPISRLCIADKYAICLVPDWLFLAMVRATGEIHEYRNKASERGEHTRGYSNRQDCAEELWLIGVKDFVHDYVMKYKDTLDDQTTGTAREANDEGVYL